MKSNLLITVCLLILKPVACLAQAEIDPDHFDTPSTPGQKPVSQSQTVRASHRAARDFQGNFSLLNDVNFAGATVRTGTYSLSIHSKADAVQITVAPTGNYFRLQMLVSKPLARDRATALVLEGDGPERKLAGVYLQNCRMVFRLSAENPTAGVKTEWVPLYRASQGPLLSQGCWRRQAQNRGSRCSE